MQIEKLLTLGEAQGIDYEKLAKAGFEVSGRRGGMTGQDVHLAMSWLPPELRAILYLRPNPARVTATELAFLTNHLWRKLYQFEAARRIHYPDEPTKGVEALLRAAGCRREARQAAVVRTALAEYEDSKLCRVCAGSKEPGCVAKHIPFEGVIYSKCKACDGRTWIPWSDNRRASAIGGRRGQWRTLREPSYLYVLGLCSDMYREGSGEFKEILFGGANLEHRMQAGV